MPLQAGFQVLGLVVTLFIALVTGAATGKNRLLHAWKNECLLKFALSLV